MGDIAWYRKYRPKTIDDYMGDHIKQVVNNRFTVAENRPNVMMVYGNRGCGKTSFARIISKYYLCENPVNGAPCEECETCKTINDILINGESGVECPGVTEVDATTANGKDAIQSIIEDAIIEPVYTKYKILILDECHMISQQAQNSLLKIIEDIPPHLIVIFATTNPEKVIGTVHSRCQLKLEVRKQTVEEMANRLMEISKQERIKTSVEALKIIAKKADRVPREAINLLESIAKNYGHVVDVANVRDSIGDIDSEIYIEYFRAANSSLEDVLLFNKKLKEQNISPKDFMSGIIRFILDSLYIKYMINIDEYPPEYIKKVKELFSKYNSEEFDMLLQIVEHASKVIDDNDIKSEMLITTTALRIGKISILTQGGLSQEALAAERENKRSISAYKSIISSETQQKNEKQSIGIDTTIQNLSEQFSGLKQVANIPSLEEIQLDVSTEPEKHADPFVEVKGKKLLAAEDLLKFIED